MKKDNNQNQSLTISYEDELHKILDDGEIESIRALFVFNSEDSNDEVIFKFQIWSAYFFPQYFKTEDAPFHDEIDRYNLAIYRGELDSFIDGIFRGAAKTTRTKLFLCFCIANDEEHIKRYMKIGTKDGKNAVKIVTSMYNHLAFGRVRYYYPEIFAKTPEKRPETMGDFYTATNIQVLATTVGVEQRGQIQDESRPDLIWFDDFETRVTLRSAVITQMIWDNMEEARTGLAEDKVGNQKYAGGCIYTCNYISERGNVNKLIEEREGRKILLVPIITKEGIITWPTRYTMERINQIKAAAEDFAGEYLNEPSAGADVYFDRASVDRQVKKVPVKEIAGLKIFHEYNASHRYGSGADTAGGVGLDSSADVIIDFTTIPARVAATFASNTISPDVFGYELINHGNRFGECIIGVENNKYDSVIRVLKEKDYPNIYFTEVDETRVGLPPKTRRYGWNTNSATKYTMLTELKTAVEDGLLELSDPALIAELRSYTRDDLMDRDEDVRLTTRHFDLLIACFVKGTMVLTDKGQIPIELLKVGDLVMTRKGYKKIIATRNHLKPVITHIGLTGTANHPVIINDNKVKDLQSICMGDNMTVWNPQTQTIESASYIKVLNIVDTQIHLKEITKSISWVGQLIKSLENTYIVKFMKIILEQFQKVFRCIIKMVIHLIILLITWSVCQLQSICGYICKNQKEKNNCDKILKTIEIKSQKQLIKQMKQDQSESSFAYNVISLLNRFHIMLRHALGNVCSVFMAKEEKKNQLKEHATFVINPSSHVYHIKRDALVNVTNLEERKNIQRVYNIEVEDQPEYFANNILVHNCAISWQMRKWSVVSKPKTSGYQQPEYQRPGLE